MEGRAIFIAGKNCGLFRGNYAWPCSITMPANFAPEKVIHPATTGTMSHQKIIMAASHINSSPGEAAETNQKQRKDGSPPGVSIPTFEMNCLRGNKR